MQDKKLIIIEQYLSWSGHYRQYFQNLLSEKHTYLYCALQKEQHPNALFLKSSYQPQRSKSFLNFIKGRFYDSFRCYSRLIKERPHAAHLIEFEPFSFLYLLIFHSKKIPKLIITVHSVERMQFANPIKNIVASLQRVVYRYTLNRAALSGATFVTHYKHHKEQLLSVIGDQFTDVVKIINYPCPTIEFHNHRSKIPTGKMLIYGQIREDKGIFEFLSLPGAENLNITIAGRIMDERILSINRVKLNIIDKFVSEEELTSIIDSHDYMLLPYAKSYSGGAGTLKDSLSFGLPVIVSDIPIFKEVVDAGKVGFTFSETSDILTLSEQISANEYKTLVENCIAYSKKYNWEYMREKYFELYQKCLDT